MPGWSLAKKVTASKGVSDNKIKVKLKGPSMARVAAGAARRSDAIGRVSYS